MLRAIKPIIASEGADYQIQFKRNEGYSLYLNDQYVGSFDTLTQALAERDRLTYDRLSRSPLAGHACDGIQYPCGKPAAYCDPQWTSADFETRRSVDLYYCPECWKEIQRIDREAREAEERAA